MSPVIPGYTQVRELGHGARSRIYLVTEDRTGRHFALKHVFRRPGDDNRFFEQAITDYTVSSAVHHPALRRGYRLHRVRRLFATRELYILMELAEGQPLEKNRPTDLPAALDIFLQVCRGLDALHEAGFIHADIKPHNIIVSPTGAVKIIDFGQACRIGTIKKRIQGTPDYIAPEQVRRLPLDRRTDVYNLGATMYWVLTDRPFPTILPAGGRAGTIEITGAKAAPPPSELNPDIPEPLSRLVMDCCQDRPARRPADMREVAARLAAIEHRMRRNNTGGTPPPRSGA